MDFENQWDESNELQEYEGRYIDRVALLSAAKKISSNRASLLLNVLEHLKLNRSRKGTDEDFELGSRKRWKHLNKKFLSQDEGGSKSQIGFEHSFKNYASTGDESDEQGLLNSNSKNSYDTFKIRDVHFKTPSTLSKKEETIELQESFIKKEPEELLEKVRQECEKIEQAYQQELHVFEEMLRMIKEHVADTGLSGTDERAEFVKLYRSLQILTAYTTANYSFFVSMSQWPNLIDAPPIELETERDIVKVSVVEYMKSSSSGFEFMLGLRVHKLSKEVATIYSKLFCNGNKTVAYWELLEKHYSHRTDWGFLRLGINIGIVITMSLWLLESALFESNLSNPQSSQQGWHDMIMYETGGWRVFRACGLILLMYWCFGLQLYVWQQARINYIVIFRIRPSQVPQPRTVFRNASWLTGVFLFCFICYMKVCRRQVEGASPTYAALFPLFVLYGTVSVWIYFIVKARGLKTFTSDIAYYIRNPARILLKLPNLFLLAVGLYPSSFFQAFICDYLTSSVKILADCVYISCYIISDGGLLHVLRPDVLPECDSSKTIARIILPVVYCWPLWLRMIQNLVRLYQTNTRWPFLANAFKYGLSHTVVIFSSLHAGLFSPEDTNVGNVWRVLFFASFVISTLWAFYWDVCVDWGLGDVNYSFLHKRLMFKRKKYYYLAIVLDFFMRFLWTLTLIPFIIIFEDQSAYNSMLQYLSGFITGFEIIRRTFWSFLRLENEHLNNTRGYRSVDFVPLYFDTPLQKESDEDAQESSSSNLLEVIVFVSIVVAFAITATLI